MKKLMVATVGSVAMMAGIAFAGCLDGSHASAETGATPIVSVEDADSGLLAKLQQQEEIERLEKLIETPPAFN